MGILIGVTSLFSKSPKIYSGVSITPYLIPLLIVVVICVGVLSFLLKILRLISDSKLGRTGIEVIDSMSGSTFEKRLKILYENLGYDVTHVGHSGDAGVDLILEKDGKRTAVQAKRWSSHVGEKAVQEIYTGCRYHHCHSSIIVTSNYFTPMAWKVAKEIGVWLVDRNGLIRLFEKEQNLKLAPEPHSIQSETISVKSTEKPEDFNNSEQSEKLVLCIKSCLDAGYEWKSIKEALIQKGWKEETLQSSYDKLFLYEINT